jgi:uncharacterized protein
VSNARLDLGVGVIATAGLDLAWDTVANLVDVIEVEPQTMWTPRRHGGWDVDEDALTWVERCDKPTLVHGVGFPVGGCHAPDPRAVALTASCADRLGAEHWSEHLSFNRVSLDGNEFDAGFLLPPAQTWAGVDAAVEHIGAYQNASGRTFLIETGVNYLQPRHGELSDGDFVAQNTERADCGILLDLHNLLTNERNGRQSVNEVLEQLPLERVLEIHVAGGFTLDGYYLDAHIGGPDAELLALLTSVLPRLPNVRAVIFEAVADAMMALGPDGLYAVLESLQRICAKPVDANRCPTTGPSCQPPSKRPRPTIRRTSTDPRWDTSDCAATRDWECQLAAYTARMSAYPPGNDPGFALLRTLADHARLSQIARGAPDLVRSLVRRYGIADTERLVAGYLEDHPPHRWTDTEANQFADWLSSPRP